MIVQRELPFWSRRSGTLKNLEGVRWQWYGRHGGRDCSRGAVEGKSAVVLSVRFSVLWLVLVVCMTLQLGSESSGKLHLSQELAAVDPAFCLAYLAGSPAAPAAMIHEAS